MNNIENMIYIIDGIQVMLDSDLAKLYDIETKRINESVKRNINKFPERFSWIISNDKIKVFVNNQRDKNSVLNLRSQTETSSYSNNYGGRRYNVRVFTEQGVSMLATILNSSIATQVSIQIMDAFVSMRHYISNGLINVDYKLLDHDKRISLLETAFDGFKEKNNHIFFEGQIYDAYSLLLGIFDNSKESIIIIDNYANKKLLDIICNTNKKIIVVSSNMDKVLIDKYMSEYKNLSIINNNYFHDRFIIIDKKILYHSGSSFKDLGNKCFAINKIEDNEYLEKILKIIL